MARPKKSADKRLTERLEIRLTSSDYSTALRSAKAAGMTISDYSRQMLLSGQVVIKQTRKLDYAAYDQLRRLGILLNQLTKTSNYTGKISPEIVRLSDRIDRLIKQNLDDL